MRLSFLILLMASGWGSGAFAQEAASAKDPGDLEAVVTTDLGTFRFEFAPDKAPRHVKEFIARAEAHYYDGSGFFRVVANGMIQGGDPLLKDPKTEKRLWGSGGLNLLPAEFSAMKHDRGVVSTVSIPGKADSDGAQFFICVVPQPGLDGKYSTFGRVTEGMSVVEKISQAQSDASGILNSPVHIVSITIEKKKEEPFIHATVSELKRTVTMKTTLGTLRIETEPDWAPENVRDFLKLTAMGWYNHTEFHRVVKGFVAQGGADGPQDARWLHTVKGEFHRDVKHVRGIVSMARGDDPDSGETSFFLVLGDSPHLDGAYSAFGRVIEGMDVLAAFDKLEVEGEKPKSRVEIIEATIDPLKP